MNETTDTSAPGLGDQVREVVSGRTGKVTGAVDYLWGCRQLLVYLDGVTDDKGDPKTEWYDISRLEVVERNVVAAITYPRSASETLADVFSGPDIPAPTR